MTLGAQNLRFVPVTRRLPVGRLTPLDVYRAFAAGNPCPVLLEGSERTEHAPRRSYIAAASRMVASFDADGCTLTHATGRVERSEENDPLKLLAAERIDVERDDTGLPPFIGGAMGYLGFECAALWEQIPGARPVSGETPLALLAFVDDVITFDPQCAEIVVTAGARIFPNGAARAANREALANAGLRADAITTRLHDLAARIGASTHDRMPASRVDVASVSGATREDTAAVTSSMSGPQFMAAVRQIQAHIAAGDVIQAVLSRRFTRPFNGNVDELYATLCAINPSPYSYLIEHDGVAIVGASPETLIQVTGDTVTTNPIAGTRPRGATVAEDEQLVAELLADPKERAEHVMLVDLGRNDVARVSRPGSTHVSQLMEVERFSHVLHIVSTVTGTIRSQLTSLDALRACFPAGTVSGAPKLRAIEIITALEPVNRGIYAGAIGMIGYDGDIDMAITLRTIIVRDGSACVQAGAGIVAESKPAAEFAETAAKARAGLLALELTQPAAAAVA